MKTQRIQTVIVLGMFSFLTSLAGSSINLALPKISTSLNISNSLATWVVQAGLIGTTVLSVLFGHFGDILSKDYIFINGGAIFIIGSLINGIAPSFTILIIGRIIQSVGIAMIMANSMGIVSEKFTDQNRTEALSAISVFISIGAISGPAIGGFILSIASWRWIFLLNVPVGLGILLFGCHTLPIPRESWLAIKEKIRTANWVGQGLFTVGILIFFLSSMLFTSHTRHELGGAILLLVGVLITVGSFIQDNRSKSPWIAPRILRNQAFMVSVSVLFLVMLVNAVSNILLPFYLQSFVGISAFNSGLIMIVQSATMLVITPFAGYLADRMDRNVLTCIGLLVLLISQIGYVSYPQTINYWRILVPVMINGLGMALFLSPNNAITMGTVEQQLSGIAGSFNSFARTLGMTIGISMASVLLFAQLPGVNHITPQLGVVFMRAFSHVFIFAAFLSLIAFIVAVSRLFVARRHLKNN